MMMWYVFFAFLWGSSWCACPFKEYLAPVCSCIDFSFGAMMSCSNVLNAEDLIAPVGSTKQIEGGIYSLTIKNSTLLYLPHDLFKGTKFEKILFMNTHLMSLSDTDTAFEGLEHSLTELRASDARYIAQWDWTHLRNLKRLELIELNYVAMNSVSEKFPELKHLYLLGIIKAKIDFISDYAFANLHNLKVLNMKNNNIKDLKRSMLPEPAKVLITLDFSHNELTALPVDFFRNMPMLLDVQLHHNKFKTLSKEVFKWPFHNLDALTLSGNPIKCDCDIRWISESKVPFEFDATCEAPKVFAGKKIEQVDFKNMKC